MRTWRAAILGCGGRGRGHAAGYAAAEHAEIVAVADPFRENADRLAAEHGSPAIYADYRALLAEQKPEVVSICTWPDLHREMVEAAVGAGVRAIHCEKPMAPTWGEALAMHQACTAAGVTLTFCHQRRFAAPFRVARDLLRAGQIGEVVRVEGYCPNFFDWGTHWFDMFHFYNDETPAAWVIGQIDTSEEHTVFGVPVETSGVSQVEFQNGVSALLFTGRAPQTPRLSPLAPRVGIVIHGSEGRLEIGNADGPRLRLRRFAHPDAAPELPALADATILSVLNLLECLESGEEPELSSARSLRATELIFATYESSRRRARIHLPLETRDSALLSMLAEPQ